MTRLKLIIHCFISVFLLWKKLMASSTAVGSLTILAVLMDSPLKSGQQILSVIAWQLTTLFSSYWFSILLFIIGSLNSFFCYNICAFITGGICYYIIDTKTKGTKRFSNPKARGCSIQTTARALLKAWGLLNHLVPLVAASNLLDKTYLALYTFKNIV